MQLDSSGPLSPDRHVIGQRGCAINERHVRAGGVNGTAWYWLVTTTGPSRLRRRVGT